MVQINFAQKEIQCKIVYYGPGMSGKTTNLELIHAKAPDGHRGELTSIATTGERTLYFDYMPLDLGQIAGISTKFQLYTVPGQIYYKSTRRLVLQGVDGIVFVADSSAAKLRENKESLSDLEDNLKEMGKTIKDVPIIIQYNKRDLEDAMSVEELEAELNPHNFPTTEATATSGEGVFPTLKSLAGMVLESVNKGSLATARARSGRRPARQTVAAPVAATASTAGSSASGGGGSRSGSGVHLPPSSPSPSSPSYAQPPAAGGGSDSQPANEETTSSVTPAPVAAPNTPIYKPRSLEDRVVAVKDLNSGQNTKVLMVLGLGALIAGLTFFVLTQF